MDVPAPSPVPGRACGRCGLCCKLLAIDALGKPEGRWCRHWSAGHRCGIYAERPGECRTFNCDWLLFPELGPEWRPDRSKIVLCTDAARKRVVAFVDPAFPGAWRAPPFFRKFKQLAHMAAAHGGQVLIRIGGRTVVVLPDGEVDLGVTASDAAITVKRTAEGWKVRVHERTEGAARDPAQAGTAA